MELENTVQPPGLLWPQRARRAWLVLTQRVLVFPPQAACYVLLEPMELGLGRYLRLPTANYVFLGPTAQLQGHRVLGLACPVQ